MAGEKLTSPSVPISVRVFSGGLNSTANPLNLQDTESPDCQNVDFDKFGSVIKRNGYTPVNTSAFNSGASWTSLHWYQLSDGSKYLVGTCGNKLAYYSDSLSGAPTDITGALTITAGNNNKFQWVTFLDTALGTNGVNVPIKWTGTGNGAAMTVPTNLTKAKWITVYQNYVILANVVVGATTSPSRMYWSDLRALTYTDINFVDIAKDDGQQITGLAVLGDRLVVFKERSIWIGVFTGDTDIPFNFIQSLSEVGAIAGYSIKNALNGLLFQSQDGIYFFDGYSSYKMSYRVQATLDGLNKNRSQYDEAVYQLEKNRYWLTCTSGAASSNDSVITYDTFNNAFSCYGKAQSAASGSTAYPANCFARVTINGQERIYFGDYSGYVYRADNGADDYPANVQTAISGYFYTKWYDEGDIVNQKGYPEAVFWYDYNSANLTISYSYDLTNGDTYSFTISTSPPGDAWDSGVWDTAVWGANGGTFYRGDLDGRGRVIRYKFSNSTILQSFKINGLGKRVYLDTNV